MPVSIAEVVEIFKKDDVVRFDQAITYLNGVQGQESLAMRAAMEAFRGGMLIGLADFFSASAVKLEAERTQLEGKKAGGSLSVDEENQLNRFKEQAATRRHLGDALRVLAGEHLVTAEKFSTDLIAQYPDKPAGYQSMARVHQLRGEWRSFDEKIKEAERRLGATPSFSVQYQRAFEAWKRNAAEEEARGVLEKLREALPDYVRVQAALVFLQPDLETRYAEMKKLIAMNPGHLLVLLAEPSMRREYETAAAIRDALAPAVARTADTDNSSAAAAAAPDADTTAAAESAETE
jgi:hypothetical protein